MARTTIPPTTLNHALRQRGLSPLAAPPPERLDREGVERWVDDFQARGGQVQPDQRKVIDQVLKTLDSKPLFEVVGPALTEPALERAGKTKPARAIKDIQGAAAVMSALEALPPKELAELEALNFNYCSLCRSGRDEQQALWALLAERCPKLEALDIGLNGLGADTLSDVVEALPGLKRLGFAGGTLQGAAGLGATLAKLSKLTHLDLELTQPDPAELRDWCEKAQPSALEALNLGSAHLDRAVVEALVQAHPSLRSLDLSHTMSKVEELAPLEHAAALEELKLDSGINFNYAAGAGQLFARIPKLKKLCAISCGLKAVELEALAEHRGVTDLELTCSGPLDDGLEALAKMGQLERRQHQQLQQPGAREAPEIVARADHARAVGLRATRHPRRGDRRLHERETPLTERQGAGRRRSAGDRRHAPARVVQLRLGEAHHARGDRVSGRPADVEEDRLPVFDRDRRAAGAVRGPPRPRGGVARAIRSRHGRARAAGEVAQDSRHQAGARHGRLAQTLFDSQSKSSLGWLAVRTRFNQRWTWASGAPLIRASSEAGRAPNMSWASSRRLERTPSTRPCAWPCSRHQRARRGGIAVRFAQCPTTAPFTCTTRSTTSS
jgi:hypothetical protein